MFRHLTLGLVLLAALSACGGGGSTGSSLPQVPTKPVGTQSVTMSILIPTAPIGGASARRRPLYISSNTNSASIAVNNGAPVIVALAPNSPNCQSSPNGRTCSVTLSAPVGTDTFTEQLFASTDGTGPALAQSTTSFPIVAGVANNVRIALDGVVASITMTLKPASPQVGSIASIALIVNMNDASGATIVGSDPFVNPVTLADSDKNTGITTLSKTTLSSPNDAVGLTLAYNGQPLTSAVITATALPNLTASATLTPQSGGPVTFNDYTTFGYDNQRDVFNPNSTAITPTSVAGLHLAWQTKIGGSGDYNVQSQPILSTKIPNHAGVLYTGGGSGYIDAHDALTGQLLWSVPTGQEVYACDPSNLGNTAVFAGSSVAYDPVAGALYVVGNKNSTTNGFAQNLLIQLDAATGALRNSVDFGKDQAGSGELNFSHTAVTLGSNGMAYVGTGATCDIPSWRGRVAAIDTRSMTLANTFFTVYDPLNLRGGGPQSWSGGGVWGWGGVSLDFNGNVLTGVGNTDDGSTPNGKTQPPFVPAPHEYSGTGESLIQLSGDLSTLLGMNHPILPQYNTYGADYDVNGTPVIFKSFGSGCPTMAALQAKSGTLAVYNTAQISESIAPTRFQLGSSVNSDGFLGDPAFSQATGLLYAPVASRQSPDLYAPGMIAINPGCGSPAVAWHSAFGPDSTANGVSPAVPAVSAGGVVFAATACDGLSGLCGSDAGYGAVWEINASDGTVLNGGNPILYTNAHIRAPATVDGNWVFVVDQAGEFYGLTIDPHYAKVAAIRQTVDKSRFFKNRTARRSILK